jgi:hypothetical protein
MTHLWAVPMWLAAGPGANQPSGQGQEFGSSGPVALILIIALLIAVAFLVRSMTKHLKKVPASFDPEPDDSQEPQETPVDEQEKQDH